MPLDRVPQEEEYGDIDAYFGTKPDVPHMWGFQYFLNEWQMGEDFFWECKKVRPQALVAESCGSTFSYLPDLCVVPAAIGPGRTPHGPRAHHEGFDHTAAWNYFKS